MINADPTSGVEEERHRTRIAAFREGDDALADALEGQVDHRTADHEAVDREPIDADRQPRPVDVDAAPQPSMLKPRQACRSMKTAPDDQACGRQATG